MAYAKRFTGKCISYRGWTYIIEIFEKDYTGTSTEATFGSGGPVISYDSETTDRFTPIISSSCEIPIVVENATIENWVQSLKTKAEKDIYIHIYRHSSAAGSPLWSGYLLMDLSTDFDEYYPYDFNLKFTDGLSLLKDIDFVKNASTIPYNSAEAWAGPARFTYWIWFILSKSGAATTAEGAALNWEFETTVDWYNKDMSGIAVGDDPLYLTNAKVHHLNSRDANGDYIVPNCYDVLKEILKTWGCRIVYWKHKFRIIQIAEYNTAESGTLTAPVNANTRVYNNSGTQTSSKQYIGSSWWTRYELQLSSASNPDNPAKLTGTKYDYLPALKRVEADYIAGGNENFYGGFPEAMSTTVAQEKVVDAADATNLFIKIPLIPIQDRSSLAAGDWEQFNFRIYYTIKADNSAYGGSVTKYLRSNNTWGAQPTIPADCKKWQSSVLQSTGTGVNTLNTQIGPDGQIGGVLIPTDTDFTGEFDFSIIVGAASGSAGTSMFRASKTSNLNSSVDATDPATLGLSWKNALSGGGTVTTLSVPIGPPPIGVGQVQPMLVHYVYNGGNPFEGDFLMLNANSGVSIYGENVLIQTSLSNSERKSFGPMLWGDAPIATASSSLTVYNGSAWVYTDVGGEWGTGTLAGNNTLTEMLLNDYFKGQVTITKLINMRIVMDSSNGYETSGGTTRPNYINPVGRLLEKRPLEPSVFYVFQKGKFYLLKDEWDYTGFEIKSESITGSSTTTTTIFDGHVPIPTNTTPAMMQAPLASGITYGASNSVIITTNAVISSGAATSIPILAIGEALFLDGDRIVLLDNESGEKHFLEINADQGASDTTLTVVSYTFDDDIAIGAMISHSEKDLIVQYQNKTRGTIAGMPVSATQLGPITYTAGRSNPYAIIGVDQDYVKILPRDFVSNDDNSQFGWVWKDGTTNTGIVPEHNDLELFAFVSIPAGKTATAVDMYGNHTKGLTIYEADVNATGWTSIGTGNTGTQVDITDVASDGTNYLIIKVATTSTTNRMYGGLVHLIDS